MDYSFSITYYSILVFSKSPPIILSSLSIILFFSYLFIPIILEQNNNAFGHCRFTSLEPTKPMPISCRESGLFYLFIFLLDSGWNGNDS